MIDRWTLIAGFLAAFGGFVAAVGAIWSAHETQQAFLLESSPAIAIGCRGAEYSPGDDNPVLFVDTQWAEYWNFGKTTGQLDDNHHRMQLPHRYIRCSIGNYGRTPVMLAKMTFHFEPGSEPLALTLTIPAIIPNTPFEINIVNIGDEPECVWPDSQLYARTPVDSDFEMFTIARAGSSRIVLGQVRVKGGKSVTVHFPPACDYSKPIAN